MKKNIYIIILLFLFQDSVFSQSSSKTYSETDFKITVLKKGGMFSVAMPPGDMNVFGLELVNEKGKIFGDYMSYHDEDTHSVIFDAVLSGKYILRIKKRENKIEKIVATRSVEVKLK